MLPHKHAVAGAPSRLHTLQWVTMVRADKYCQEREERKRKSPRSEGIRAVSRSSIHQSMQHPPPLFTLLNPSPLLSGGLCQTLTTCSHSMNIHNGIYTSFESVPSIFMHISSRENLAVTGTQIHTQQVERPSVGAEGCLYGIFTLCW